MQYLVDKTEEVNGAINDLMVQWWALSVEFQSVEFQSVE
jgi:hypothetical protein